MNKAKRQEGVPFFHRQIVRFVSEWQSHLNQSSSASCVREKACARIRFLNGVVSRLIVSRRSWSKSSLQKSEITCSGSFAANLPIKLKTTDTAEPVLGLITTDDLSANL